MIHNSVYFHGILAIYTKLRKQRLETYFIHNSVYTYSELSDTTIYIYHIFLRSIGGMINSGSPENKIQKIRLRPNLAVQDTNDAPSISYYNVK